jgi:hypothetical protein
MSQKTVFVQAYRGKVGDLLSVIEALNAMRAQYDALGYGDAEIGLVDADCVMNENNITAVEFKSAVSSIETLGTSFMAVGHATNLYKVAR